MAGNLEGLKELATAVGSLPPPFLFPPGGSAIQPQS